MSRPAHVAQEIMAIGMVGNGVVAGLFTRRHLELWNFDTWPAWYRNMVRRTQDRPWIVRGIALAEVALGLWWAYCLVRRYTAAAPLAATSATDRDWERSQKPA
ncbi:MAG: hypothetical protein M0R73_07890 [Dehalococcoidia bacterium]|nr:hypothetical protein [Dehalococcoidia bacterium]